MILRRFQREDVPALTTMIHRAYAELGRMGLNFTGVDQPEEVTLKRAEGGPTWVLQDGDSLVACLTISWPAEDALARLTSQATVPGRAWLNQVAVDPAFRGVGAARFLRDVGYAWCRAHGATSMGLDTAEPAAHLRELYAAWGFKEVGMVQWPGKRYRSLVMTQPLPGTPAAFAEYASQEHAVVQW